MFQATLAPLGRTLHVVVAFALIVVAGCSRGSGVNVNNFDRLRTGMSFREVEDILGKGTELKSEEIVELLRSFREVPADAAGKAPAAKSPPIDASGYRGYRWKDGKKIVSVLMQNDRLYLPFKEGF